MNSREVKIFFKKKKQTSTNLKTKKDCMHLLLHLLTETIAFDKRNEKEVNRAKNTMFFIKPKRASFLLHLLSPLLLISSTSFFSLSHGAFQFHNPPSLQLQGTLTFLFESFCSADVCMLVNLKQH